MKIAKLFNQNLWILIVHIGILSLEGTGMLAAALLQGETMR